MEARRNACLAAPSFLSKRAAPNVSRRPRPAPQNHHSVPQTDTPHAKSHQCVTTGKRGGAGRAPIQMLPIKSRWRPPRARRPFSPPKTHLVRRPGPPERAMMGKTERVRLHEAGARLQGVLKKQKNSERLWLDHFQHVKHSQHLLPPTPLKPPSARPRPTLPVPPSVRARGRTHCCPTLAFGSPFGTHRPAQFDAARVLLFHGRTACPRWRRQACVGRDASAADGVEGDVNKKMKNQSIKRGAAPRLLVARLCDGVCCCCLKERKQGVVCITKKKRKSGFLSSISV